MDLDIHQANFDVDERAIGVGVRLLAASALIALAGQSAGSAQPAQSPQPAPEEAVASARGAA
jgi:hypothetical protein